MQELKSWNASSVAHALARHSYGRRLLSSIGPKLIRKDINGFEMMLDLTDSWGASKYILKHGIYDPEYCFLTEALVPKSGTCLDIGANIGFWSMFMVTALKSKLIIAVEPEPKNFALLKANIELNKRSEKFELHHCAVGEKTDELKLYLSEDNAGDHQLYSSDESRASMTVPVRKVDDLVHGRPVDFIKMDIQGYEPFALRGMMETLKANPEVVILTEWWPAGIAKTGIDHREALATLLDLGFKMYLVEAGVLKESNFEAIDAQTKTGHHVDLILTRKKLQPMRTSAN